MFIDTVDAGEPSPDSLHGVYWASGRIFFPLEPSTKRSMVFGR